MQTQAASVVSGNSVVVHGWRILSPIWYIPWVTLAFLYTLLITGVSVVRKIAESLITFRGLAPFVILIIGFGFLVFQTNQDIVIDILDTVTGCIDEIYKEIIKAIFDDIFRCAWPLCTIYNWIVQVIKYNIRVLVNEYRCYYTCDGVACECEYTGGCMFPGGAFAAFESNACCACFKEVFVIALQSAGIPFVDALNILTTVIDYLDIAPPPSGPLFDDYLGQFPNPGDCDWTWDLSAQACNTRSVPFVSHNTTTRTRSVQTREIPDNILDAFTSPAGADYSTIFFQVFCGDVLDPFLEFYGELLLWLFHFLLNVFSESWTMIVGPFIADPSGSILNVIDNVFQLFTKEFMCMLLNWTNAPEPPGANLSVCCENLSFEGPLEFVVSLFTEECLGSVGRVFLCLIDNADSPADILDCLSVGGLECVVGTCETNSDCGDDLCKCKGFIPAGSLPLGQPLEDIPGACTPDVKKRAMDVKVANVRAVYGNETADLYSRIILEEHREYNIRMEMAQNNYHDMLDRSRRGVQERAAKFRENIANSETLKAFAKKKHFKLLKAGDIKESRRFERYISKSDISENTRRVQFESQTGHHSSQTRFESSKDDWTAGGKYQDKLSYTMKYGASNIYADSAGFFSSLGLVGNVLLNKLNALATEHVEHMNKRAAVMLSDHYSLGGNLRDLGYRLPPGEDHTLIMKDGLRAIEAASGWMDDMRHIFSYVQWDPHQYDFVVPSRRDMETTLNSRKVGAKLRAVVDHGARFIRTSNNINFPRGERPAFYIELEVTLKTIVRRFFAPDSLNVLRDTLSKRGEAYRETATRLINPVIDEYQEKLAKRDAVISERLAALEQASEGSGKINLASIPLPLLEPITFHSYMTWSKHASQKKAAARGVEERLDQDRVRTTHDYDRTMKNGRENATKLHKFFQKSQPITLTRGVSPELVEFFKDHRERLARATSPEQSFQEYKTTLTRLPQLAAVGAAILPFLKNWKVVAGAAVPFLTSPYGQIIIGRYGELAFSVFQNIYGEPLDTLVTPAFLTQLAEDFSLLTLDNILYVVTELLRFLLCQWFSIVLLFIKAVAGPFLTLIPYVGAILSTVVGWLTSAGSLLSPLISYCPPKVVVINNVPQQRPWNWFLDILDCDSTQACTTEAQCPGQAPCRCSPAYGTNSNAVAQPQYTTFFWAFNGDFNTPCPGNSGVCLCWPELPCDFALPELVFNEPFAKNCRDFGYNIDDITPWYINGPGIFSFIVAVVQNTLISIQFITRTIVRGYDPFLSMDNMLLVTGLLVGLSIMFGRWMWMVVLVIVLFGITFGSPLLTEVVANVVIPAVEDFGAKNAYLQSVTDWLLGFFRFDNHTPADPIGSPELGEFTCFFFNLGTFFIGIAALYLLILYTMFLSEMFVAIILYILYWILIPFRVTWAVIEACIGVARMEEQQSMEMGSGYSGGVGGGYDGGGYSGYSLPVGSSYNYDTVAEFDPDYWYESPEGWINIIASKAAVIGASRVMSYDAWLQENTRLLKKKSQ